jgi:hypothetical protein
VRKRSRSSQETEDSRATDPARRESGPEAPEEQKTEKAPKLRLFGGMRKRPPKRSAEQDSVQASLFEDATPHPTQGAPVAPAPVAAPDVPPSNGDPSEAKKSRSKRRRERRKAAKASDQGPHAAPSPDEAPSPGEIRSQGELRSPKSPRQAPKGGTQQKSPRSPTPRPAEGERRGGQRIDNRGGDRRQDRPSQARGHDQSRPRVEDRRPYAPRDNGPGVKSGRRPEAYREKRHAEGGAYKRNHPEGLPPLSPEDLAAVAQTGYDDGAIPHYVSNERGRPRGASAPAQSSARRLETLSSSSASIAALDALEGVLDEAVPLQAKHRAELKGDIRRLWEELTSDKESRSAEYLGSPPALSAYLRYFLPWNVFRLTSLLTNADFCLPDNAVIADIGSGPLTLPIALWISRPELREVPLTIYCMDRVERVMETGLTIFETLCMRVGGRLPPWRIELRKDSFGSQLPERAHLLTAANVFNEFFWKDKRNLGERALDTARSLLSYIKENGSIFVMEPGDPRSGAFITALRAALLAEGAPPLGPCPHSLSCPMPGIFRHLLPPEETRAVKGDPNAAPSRYVLPIVVMPKKRDKYPWCHFGIDALKAPAWLEALSEEAGLPKERAVLSYLWAARGAMVRPPVGMPESSGRGSERERRAKAGRGILVRVVSDPFPLPDGSSGQYACSSIGYTMLRRPRGEEAFGSGDLLEVTTASMQRTDDKSGAVILST